MLPDPALLAAPGADHMVEPYRSSAEALASALTEVVAGHLRPTAVAHLVLAYLLRAGPTLAVAHLVLANLLLVVPPIRVFGLPFPSHYPNSIRVP